MVWGLGFEVWDLGYRVSGFGFWVLGFGFRVSLKVTPFHLLPRSRGPADEEFADLYACSYYVWIDLIDIVFLIALYIYVYIRTYMFEYIFLKIYTKSNAWSRGTYHIHIYKYIHNQMPGENASAPPLTESRPCRYQIC